MSKHYVSLCFKTNIHSTMSLKTTSLCISIVGVFLKEQGAYKYWTLAQGLKWSGGNTFDDFC